MLILRKNGLLGFASAMDISVVKFFQLHHLWLVRFLEWNKHGKRKLCYIELLGIVLRFQKRTTKVSILD